MDSQTIKGCDDFLSAFENLSVAAIPPPKETSPPPQETSLAAALPRSIFSFLDSPSFQDDDEDDDCAAVEWAPPPYPTYNESGGYYENADYGYGYDSAGLPAYSFLQMATNPESSELLRNCLVQGMYVKETFAEVFPSLFLLMSDENGRKVFQLILNFCAYSDLKLILKKFLSEKDSFALTALCENGSRAIQAFVRKLKNTGMERDLTALIAESAYLFMTHKFAYHVVKQCFEVLGDEPNKTLYRSLLLLFHNLAMDPVGCISINAAIDNVRGLERIYLLVMVVKNALQLSFDPYGNYVVQHCLKMKSEEVIRGICLALRGEFVVLAKKREGSFVVEKCLECSEFGRILVLSEIFKDDKTLLMLAKDGFANYPVQMALEVTRIHDKATYEKMVKVLEPRFDALIKKAISGTRRARKDSMKNDKLLMMLKNM